MLSKKERAIMQVLCNESKDKSSILISPNDILSILKKENLSLKDVDKILSDLNADGYFDLIYSDRHGELVYWIALSNKGKAFLRDQKLLKRNLLFRLCATIIFALISFFIGIILKKLF